MECNQKTAIHIREQCIIEISTGAFLFFIHFLIPCFLHGHHAKVFISRNFSSIVCAPQYYGFTATEMTSSRFHHFRER